MTYEQLKEIVYANSINDYWAQQTLAAVQKYSASLTAAKPIVSGALPLKVCTGCGWRNDKPLRSKMALACCPDNHYVELDDYLKHSVYKRQ